ncbi:MAG TPA: hypothetical protein VMV74_02035 [Bacteroidales bacterium]|nr:hypothetical protein [Bacteroidales bacterium]
MLPREVYNSRADTFGARADRLQKRADRMSFARLISFVGGLVLFVALSSLSVIAAFTVLTVSLIVFMALVIRNSSTEKKKRTSNTLRRKK